MDAVKAIVPVLFMLALGILVRKKHILSPEHNAGIKKLIFSILLPILVFNASFTMSVDPKYMQLMGFMFALQCIALGAGSILFRLVKLPQAHIAPYLMTTIEGGNAFYPLYIGLVGTGFTSYFVLLDIPGIFMIFLVIPLLLAKFTSQGAGHGGMLRSIYTNPIVCALIAGIILNISGVARLFMATPVFPVYEALASTATTPIAPLILFTLGYSFRIGRGKLLPMIKTLIVRMLLMGCGIAAAFAIFPWILEDAALKIAVILFLMSPPAFAMPIILEKVFRQESDGEFCSTYISLHMLATVVVFAVIALFIA